MNPTRLALVLLLASAYLGVAAYPAQAAQLVALAPEEELYTDVFPNAPAVAAQPGGPYVIAWDDDTFSQNEGSFSYRYTASGEDTGSGIYRSIYSPTGAPAVDSVTAGRQGFDVIWHTLQSEGEPTVFYRAHLDLRGRREGKPIRLGGPGTEWVWQVRGNGFMAGYPLPAQHGIAARRLAASGQPAGPELRLNSRPVDHPTGVSVVGLADASFVAVWLGVLPGSPGTAVLRARRFFPAGKPLGPDFDVNTSPLGAFEYPNFGFDSALKVAAAPGGGFTVAWQLQEKTYLRWFNAAGTPLGPDFLAIRSPDPDGLPQSMAFDDTGNLVLLWEDQLRLFDPRGTPIGPPMAVNDDDTEEPRGGGVTWAGDSWIVAWEAAIPPYDQGSVFVRRFAKR
jgi:hypothetical protein